MSFEKEYPNTLNQAEVLKGSIESMQTVIKDIGKNQIFNVRRIIKLEKILLNIENRIKRIEPIVYEGSVLDWED